MSPPATPIDRVHRRRRLKRMALAVLGACLDLLGCSATRGEPGTHPDVVLITIDTLRADHVGCYGNRDASTPVMDVLARDGVRFASVVAPTPLTLPSHVSLMTGTTPLVHGVRDNVGFVLGTGLSSAAERFQASGYRTAAFVSGYPLHRRFGLSRGFDHYDDRFTRGGTAARPEPVERRADETIAAVDAWIRSGPNLPDRPLFLWVHLFDPHAPYEPPEPFLARFSSRRYDGEIAFTDSQIGVLLGRLDGARPGRPRVVAVTADHGEGLGEHGEATHGLFIYDSTVRVPLILSGTDLPIGRTVPVTASLIDVAPTLLDLASIPPMASAGGTSLRSVMNGESATRPAYSESLFGRLCCGWAPLHGWRDGRWQYIDAPQPELYDLASDSGEHHNLAATQPHDASRLAVALSAALARQAPVAPGSPQMADRDRLRSLGYVSGSVGAKPSLRDPKDMVDVSARLGVALELEEQEPLRAVREFEHVLQDDPTNPLARRHLALALGRQNQLDRAIKLLASLVSDGDTSAETLNGLGRALLAARRTGEAKLAFDRALQRAPDDVEALRYLADLAIERADFTDARSKLELAYRSEPGNGDIALKLGIVLLRVGETQPAIDVLKGLVDREPTNRDALLDLGGALLRLERYSDAVPYFERAIAAGADSPLAWNGLATAKINTNDRAGAARALRRSLQLEPDQSDARAALKALVR